MRCGTGDGSHGNSGGFIDFCSDDNVSHSCRDSRCDRFLLSSTVCISTVSYSFNLISISISINISIGISISRLVAHTDGKVLGHFFHATNADLSTEVANGSISNTRSM